jgi:hypothetical protein
MIYHTSISLCTNLAPEKNKYTQLWIYDPQTASKRRANNNPDLDPNILLDLTVLLSGCNELIKKYKTSVKRLRNAPQANRVILNCRIKLIIKSGTDMRRQNLPRLDEITIIIKNETLSADKRDIVLIKRDGDNFHRIYIKHTAYVSTHYVFFFPYGEAG